MRTWLMLVLLTLFGVNASAAHAQSTSPSTPASSTPTPREFQDFPQAPMMAWLPAGSFEMGASLAEEARQGMPPALRGHSLPVHQVTFAKGFAMSIYPVTVAEFRAFVIATGYNAGNSCYAEIQQDGHYVYESAPGYSWRDPGYPQGDNYPVVCISEEDGEAYAAWLSKKTGHSYAVPNEAQYEYALRAGTTTSFFWSNDRNTEACLYANEPDLTQADEKKLPAGPDWRFPCHDGYAYTSPVGHYKPNAFGLYDMQGNIWEYTSDCYNPNYNGAPTDGSTWKTGDCDSVLARGGSFGNAVFSAYAGIRAPRGADYRGHSFGFRVVMTQ